MRMHLISNNSDTNVGMRLVGIDGALVHTYEELKNEIEKIKMDKEIGIVLVVEELAEEFPALIQDLKLARVLPLVVEIPGRNGTRRGEDSISSYIKEAIGVR